MKKIISAILTLFISVAMITPAIADDDITVIVSGSRVYFNDTAPFIENERTLVPMRAIFEALGAFVIWDDATRTVTAYDVESDTEITLKIDSYTMYVGDTPIQLDVAAKIVGASTVIPLRAVAESMNCNVDWDDNTRTITINSKTKVNHAYTAGNVLTLGTNAAFPPFEYTTENGLVGEFDGIDIAIAKKIAEDNGMELYIEDMEFDGLVSAAASDKIDMIVSGMVITDVRKEDLDFSDIYYKDTQVILVRADNTDINSVEDILSTKKVGVVLGYSADWQLFDLGINEDNIIRANRARDIIEDLKNSRLDAVVIDENVGRAAVKDGSLRVIYDPVALETDEYAIGVKKGNTELLQMINSTIAEMKASGEIEELAVKYGSNDGN